MTGKIELRKIREPDSEVAAAARDSIQVLNESRSAPD